MELIFDWNHIPSRGRGLTYDDVLIVPSKSDVRSRKDPDLSTRLTSNIRINKPFISANMDTVTEEAMAYAMDELGGFGILHRFMSTEDQVKQVQKLKEKGLKNIGASIGVNQDYQERAHALIKEGVNVITIDIAHGHSVQMLETMKWLKDSYPDVELIVGNVATPQGVEDLCEAGASAIKVGIGPGSMCTTRIITGCGVPQLTAVALCAQVAREKNIPVIADGGIKTSGDIVKALAAGAETVMLGSILSGVLETPGEVRGGKKQYRGMASKAAQVSWRGGVPEGMAPEGESTYVPVKGHLSHVINELAGGLRSGMSYINACSIDEISQKARFIEMTSAGSFESRAHGLRT
ncbi:MAG: guanosine monophosphate reductase [Bdellovibrionales bacterium]|nr:guanosine monophosphate reductase [Bdellovibrionales bacterium]